jgi:hypothetical protein
MIYLGEWCEFVFSITHQPHAQACFYICVFDANTNHMHNTCFYICVFDAMLTTLLNNCILFI